MIVGGSIFCKNNFFSINQELGCGNIAGVIVDVTII